MRSNQNKLLKEIGLYLQQTLADEVVYTAAGLPFVIAVKTLPHILSLPKLTVLAVAIAAVSTA